LAKYLKTDDPEALDEAYESIVEALIPAKPYPTLKGIDIILRELGVKDPNARSAKPEQFVDLTFIKELDGSGFIDRLYNSSTVAKALPRSETVVVPEVAKENPSPMEAKAKPVTTAEKPKPVAKQVPASTERPMATPVTGQASRSATQEYTVKAGDTLSKLAERFYNSMSKWQKIYEANRDTLKNPNYIYIGQKLMIPLDDQAS